MNIRNVHNSIPLHLALARGAKACVGLLLAAEADYNLQVFIQVPISTALSRTQIKYNHNYDDIKFPISGCTIVC